MKKLSPKRIALIAVSIIILLLLLCYIPMREDKSFSYRVVPQNALVASYHANAANAWAGYNHNKVASELFKQTGLDHGIINIVLKLTTGENTVIAYTPALGENSEPALVGASWCGIRKPIQQLLLALRWIPGCPRLQVTDKGVKYLQLGTERNPSPLRASFLVYNDTLVACLSEDPDSILALKEQATEKSKATPPVFFNDTEPWNKAFNNVPHNFWVIFDGTQPPSADNNAFLTLSTPTQDELQLTAKICNSNKIIENVLPKTIDTNLKGLSAQGSSLAMDDATAILMLPAQQVRNFLCSGLNIDATPSKSSDREDAVVYITGQPYEGRVLNIAIPAVTAIIPNLSITPQQFSTAVHSLSIGSIRQNTSTDKGELILIDWLASLTSFVKLANPECISFEHTTLNNLIACSSYGSIAKQQESQPEPNPVWKTFMNQQLKNSNGQAKGFAWIHTQKLIEELRGVFAVYRMANMFGGIKLDRKTKNQISEVQNVIDNLNTDICLGAILSQDDNDTKLTLTAIIP